MISTTKKHHTKNSAQNKIHLVTRILWDLPSVKGTAYAFMDSGFNVWGVQSS